MSFWNWLFRRKKPPTIFLGDVQMHLEWNLLSAFSDGFHYTWADKPSPEILQEHFANALGLPRLSEEELPPRFGDKLFHFAIIDLRKGCLDSINGSDFFLPIFIRPSVTVHGYLIDLHSGDLLAEARATQKPGWLRYRNPRIIGPMLCAQFLPFPYSQSDPAGHAMQPPMCEAAAIKVLQKLVKTAKQAEKQRIAQNAYLLEKNNTT
ncbi:hypothetical protein [Roseibium sp. M-1]